MPGLVQRIAVALLIAAAATRLAATVLAPVEHPSDLMLLRDLARHALASGDDRFSQPGVESITFERFDHGAAVVLLPGADGQPGVADVDDNGNAVTDDRSELGATGSDDVCLVRPINDPQRRDWELSAETGRMRLILERGAFVPVEPAQIAPSDRLRAVVSGRTGDDHWSFLVSMP